MAASYYIERKIEAPEVETPKKEEEKRSHRPAESLPTSVLCYTLSFGNNWALLNANRAIKSWHTALATPLKELKAIHLTLAAKEAKEIVELCLTSVKTAQATLMSSTLLAKLTLDDVTTIACSSSEHAKVVLKSQIFNQRPIDRIPKTSSSFAAGSEWGETYSALLKEFELSSVFKPTIYGRLLKISDIDSDLENAIRKLLQPDLLEEEKNQLPSKWYREHATGRELVTLYKVNETLVCQAYIARAMAEKNPDFARLVLGHLRIKHVFPANRLLSIAKLGIAYTRVIIEECLIDFEFLLRLARLSEEHAKVVLARNLITGELRLKQIQELASINQDYKKLVISHCISLIIKLPVILIKNTKNPGTIKQIALTLLNNSFYDRQRNPYFAKWSQKNPELANLTLTAWSMPSRHAMMPIIIKQLMAISDSSREQILAIKGIDKILNLPRDKIESQDSDNTRSPSPTKR